MKLKKKKKIPRYSNIEDIKLHDKIFYKEANCQIYLN